MASLWPIVFIVLSGCALQAQSPDDLCFNAGDISASAKCAQTAGMNPEAGDSNDAVTMWPHPDNTRYWISGQSNTIFQAHPEFHAEYSGVNSLQAKGEYKTSLLNTVYLGMQAARNTEIFIDIESAGGSAISQASGLAGFTDLDAVRNPKLGPSPYIARVMLRQIIPLGKSRTPSSRGPLSLATELPTRRLDFRIGRFSTVDFFDANSVGSDSHLQFMNWTIDNNGAFDYAADTRGYTWAGMVEFQDRSWGVRFGEMLMPTVPNGLNLIWNLRRARAENIEVEMRGSLLHGRTCTIRLLSFFNHANMGTYDDAIHNFEAGLTPVPDLTAHTFQTTMKYGFGVN